MGSRAAQPRAIQLFSRPIWRLSREKRNAIPAGAPRRSAQSSRFAEKKCKPLNELTTEEFQSVEKQFGADVAEGFRSRPGDATAQSRRRARNERGAQATGTLEKRFSRRKRNDVTSRAFLVSAAEERFALVLSHVACSAGEYSAAVRRGLSPRARDGYDC
jgi:hypothetical protein